jgi:hypothetical protein
MPFRRLNDVLGQIWAFSVRSEHGQQSAPTIAIEKLRTGNVADAGAG